MTVGRITFNNGARSGPVWTPNPECAKHSPQTPHCRNCGTAQEHHINDRFCPEWSLREKYGR